MRSARMNAVLGSLMAGTALAPAVVPPLVNADGTRMRGLVPASVRAEGPSDLKAAVDEVKSLFAKFQEANDERLSDADKRLGSIDALLEEKTDKINADLSAAADKYDQMAKELERLKLGGTEAHEEVDVRAMAAKFHAGKRAVPAVEISDADVEAYEQYVASYAQYLSRPIDTLPMDVRNAMQVGSDPDGGYWVPTEMSNDIKRRIFETSPIRSIASVVAIGTDSIKFPTAANDWASGGWVGETEARSETATPEVGEQEIHVREQYAEPRVTQKLLDMAEINVEEYVNGGIAGILARTENTAFVSGIGVNRPRGFLDYRTAAVTTADASRSWGVLQYVVTGASAGFPVVSGIAGSSDADALITIVNELNPAYLAGARWVMSRRTLAAIRKLKDGNGRYLVGSMRDVESSFAGFDIGGFPVTAAEDMPAIASDSFSAAFGNFAIGYQIVDGRGIRILRDNLTSKPWVKFYTTKWTGGDVVNFDAIKLLKFGTS